MRRIIDEEKKREIREFFGIKLPLKRKPFPPSNTFKNLVNFYALLPDQQNNPFAEYKDDPDFAQTYPWPRWTTIGLNPSMEKKSDKDGEHDNSVPRGNAEASNVSINSSGVEVSELFIRNSISDLIAHASFREDVLNGLRKGINKVGKSKALELLGPELLDKILNDTDDTNVEATRHCNVRENLSSIQRILMDESDDADMQQLLDKDATLDLAGDFCSILGVDRSCDKPSTMKYTENEKPAAADETKRKHVEANQSTSECNIGICQVPKSADAGVSSSPEVVDQKVKRLKDARKMDTKLHEHTVPQEMTEIGGLTSIGREIGQVGQFSSGKFDNNLGRRNRVIVSGLKAKGQKTNVKIGKKMSGKNAESGKHKLSHVEGEANNSMRSEGDDLMVHGKTVKQNALAISGNPSMNMDKESWSKGCERLQYTRVQLLNIRKTAIIPEHIQKAVRGIGVEIHEKQQISAAFKAADSSILKKKRGGSSSEAKKEKKKLKKRKKRAELNRQLGVKRLKLQPIVKPKVVQHCRHYLMGRCHEGEKCKFSHDVVPLTKSKPCCHFARQACMKGDECPYDHALSKYPCNSYADTGFCSRGESCLFSHKIPVKAASELSDVSLKCDAGSADQYDVSKSKQQADTIVQHSTSGKARPTNLKQTLAAQTIKPQRPKGLSFLTSHLDDAVQPKESDTSQKSYNTAGTNVKPNMIAEAAPDSRKTTLNIPGSVTRSKRPTPYEAYNSSESLPTPTPTPERDPNFSAMYSQAPTFDLSEILKSITTTTPTPERALNSSEISKGPTPIPERALKPSELLKGTPTPTLTPTQTPAATPTPTLIATPTPQRAINLSEMLKVTPSPTPALTATCTSTSTSTLIGTRTPTTERSLNLAEMLKGALTQSKAKGVSVSSSDVPTSDILSRAKSVTVSTMQEKGNMNASSEKLMKEVQPEPGCGSLSSSGQFSSKVDLSVKKPVNNSQRALQSALAFASKYESGIKMSTMAASKENNLNDGTSCSGVRQSGPIQASKILQFLNRKGDKEK